MYGTQYPTTNAYPYISIDLSYIVEYPTDCGFVVSLIIHARTLTEVANNVLGQHQMSCPWHRTAIGISGNYSTSGDSTLLTCHSNSGNLVAYCPNRPFPPTFAIQREREKLRYWVGFFGVLSSPLKTAFGTIGNCRLRSN